MPSRLFSGRGSGGAVVTIAILVVATLVVTVASAALVSARSQPGVITRAEIALAGDRIRADRWYDEDLSVGTSQAGRLNRSADLQLLTQALTQPFGELRGAAVREFGRLGRAENAPLIAALLDDPDPVVRREAADALVQSLYDKSPEVVAPWALAIEAKATQNYASPLLPFYWQALVQLPLTTQTWQKLELQFVNEILQTKAQRQAALDALWTMARTPDTTLSARTKQQMLVWARKGLDARQLDVPMGTLSIGPLIQYLEILQAVRAEADDVAMSAAKFFCIRGSQQCGTDIRRLGTEMLNPANPAHIPALLERARDRTDMQAVESAIRRLLKSPAVRRCDLLDLAHDTGAEVDVIAALADKDPARHEECGGWSSEVWLTQQANELMSATQGTTWAAPTAAMEALAELNPDAVRELVIERAASHPVWQVRAAAARVGRSLKDEDLAARLATDANANVQAAAIETLAQMSSDLVWPAAYNALGSTDRHLLRTAANALKGAPAPQLVLPALFRAFDRLTTEGHDSSRRARLALLERVDELSAGGVDDMDDWTGRFNRYIRDYDPYVARAAAALMTSRQETPVTADATRRDPEQPTAEQLQTLPPCVMVNLEDDGVIVVLLNRGVAPIAVARFLEAAARGDYNDSLIYHLDENVSLFGSPFDNDEGGWSRFARDEPSTEVLPLSLTLAHEGPDTADGRLSFRWHGSPQLAREETVIGQGRIPRQVSRSAPRQVQRGKRIRSIVVGGEGRLERAGPADPCFPGRPVALR